MTASLLGGFNTGLSRVIAIIDSATQLPVPFGGDMLDYESSPITKDISISPISTGGYDKFKTDRAGWQGSFTIARVNGDADNFEAIQEALYHSGGPQKQFTITETTTNDDGSVDVMQISGCELHMTNAGQCRKETSIDMKFAFRGMARQAPQ